MFAPIEERANKVDGKVAPKASSEQFSGTDCPEPRTSIATQIDQHLSGSIIYGVKCSTHQENRNQEGLERSPQ